MAPFRRHRESLRPGICRLAGGGLGNSIFPIGINVRPCVHGSMHRPYAGMLHAFNSIDEPRRAGLYLVGQSFVAE
jgi:hypothetical protein